tara:strand:+ start:737 stop:895 length:159 start_codon:yes stop_codon:yes gene_type:complete
MQTKIKYSFTDPLGNSAIQTDTFEGLEIDDCVALLSESFSTDLIILSAQYIC